MEILQFVVLGIVTGGLYALLAQGLVLVYRGSGLLNFAQGAVALMGGCAYYELVVRVGLWRWTAAVFAVVLCGTLGAAIHYAVLRPMRNTSPLQRVIATLGIVMVIQSAAYLRYGFDPLRVPSLFPTDPVSLGTTGLSVGFDRLAIIAVCLIVSVALFIGYRNSSFGKVTTAVAENELTAASLGYSPDRIAAVNWALSSGLAGLVGVLISPIIFLEPTALVLLVIPAMSAALLGGFSSFPSTLATALALGVGQSLIQRYVSAPGWAMAVPFFAVLAILLARGRALPLRSYVLERLPGVGTGRVRPLATALLTLGAAILVGLVMNADWATATVVTLSTAIICLSVVVLTGYTGQLSLAQVALAGIGALMASRLTMVGFPFLLACLAAALLTALVGLLIGIPALRIRGITLAVVTWGLAAALTNLVLLNGDYTGGFSGLEVPVPSAFGVDLDPFLYPERYALFVLLALVAISLGVANLRRGQVGRRLLAVRSNERAAAALGVHVTATKSYAFALSAAIASLGGTFLVFSRPVAEFSAFTLFLGIVVVAVTVVGGVGYVPGALLGATLVSGGIAAMIFEDLPSVHYYMPLVGGIFLLLVLILGPDGLFEMNRQQLAAVPWRRLLRLPARAASTPKYDSDTRAAPVRVPPKELVVENLSVSFGGVHAVRDVSITVKPGEVHGVIGPNGAGKTTLIDGITGFVKSTATAIRVGDQEVSAVSTRQRVRAGVSRSFQSLELFSGLTVRENLAIAGERPGVLKYLLDLAYPGSAVLTPAAWEAVTRFELADLIDELPENASFGHRKAIAIARSVASSPSILLLDEPAAGLGDAEAEELCELIKVLAVEWGIGILLVEHNVDLVLRLSDRVTVIQSGAVIKSGRPDEVASDPLVIDAYLGAPH